MNIINVIILVGVDLYAKSKTWNWKVNLRRYKESDVDAIYEIITDERLSRYIKFPNLTKDEELECIKTWISEADESKYENGW